MRYSKFAAVINGYTVFSSVDLTLFLLQKAFQVIFFQKSVNRLVKLKYNNLKIEPSRFGVMLLKNNLQALRKLKKSGIITLHHEGRSLTTQIEFVLATQEYFCKSQKWWYQTEKIPHHVLDIGGYIRDSALEFYEMGAKSVTVVEPISANIHLAKMNLQKFPHTRFIQKALALTAGPIHITSNFPLGSMGFATPGNKYTASVEGSTIEELIDKDYDVVKMDCEGAEKILLTLSADILQKVPYWIIEVHHFALKEPDLVRHMLECGFRKTREHYVNSECNILHFKLI